MCFNFHKIIPFVRYKDNLNTYFFINNHANHSGKKGENRREIRGERSKMPVKRQAWRRAGETVLGWERMGEKLGTLVKGGIYYMTETIMNNFINTML